MVTRLEKTEKKEDVAERLALLIDDITSSIYLNVCRGLFEKDQTKRAEAKRLEAIAQDKRDELARCARHALTVTAHCRPCPSATTRTRALNSPHSCMLSCRKKRERSTSDEARQRRHRLRNVFVPA